MFDKDVLEEMIQEIEAMGISFPNEEEKMKFAKILAQGSKKEVTDFKKGGVPSALVRMEKGSDSLGIAPKSPRSPFGKRVKDVLVNAEAFNRDGREGIRAISRNRITTGFANRI